MMLDNCLRSGTLLLILTLQVVLSNASALEDPVSLNKSLSEISKTSSKKIPSSSKEIINKSLLNLEKNKIIDGVIKIGQQFPDSKLLNSESKVQSLHKLGEEKSLVVVFYRGEWCPYCNAHLKFLEKSYADFLKAGATVIAISPDKPEFSLSAKSKNKLGFKVLSDTNNKLAKSIGIVFKLEEDLKKVYQNFGIDLVKNQGNNTWELPLAATFVLDKQKNVAWRFVDIDYKKRADPADILAALKALQVDKK